MDTDSFFQGKEFSTDTRTLQNVISLSCQKYADLTAFSCEGGQLSYRKLDSLSEQFAAWLLSEPALLPGDRVAIQLPNLLQYPVVALGIIKAGMVIVNINPLYTAGETEYQLADSGAKALVILEDVLPVTSRILPGTSIEKVIVTSPADLHPSRLKLAFNVLSWVKGRRIDPIKLKGRAGFLSALSLGRKLLGKQSLSSMLPVRTSSEAVLGLIQYTGGTTGTSKGAMLTHDNLLANVLQLEHVNEAHCPPPGSIMLAPLPFYHIYAFTLNFIYSLYAGYHGVLIPDPRNTDKLVNTIRRHKMVGLVGINTLYQRLCRHPEFQQIDFSALSVCTSGGMTLSVSTARRWEKLTGCKILEGYGLTETSPLVASGKYSDYREGKIGRSTLWTELKIINPEGNALPAGEAGEILVRGPQIMLGYWNKPDETREVLGSDGWLKTGDIGILDDDGYLTVVDRIKDMVLVSGFNVYPAEIEDHILRHPDIREAAVIGVAENDDEYVKLFVISDNPDLKEEDIMQFCRQGLTAYKIPRKVEFRATLPRSNVGKILKRHLREEQLC